MDIFEYLMVMVAIIYRRNMGRTALHLARPGLVGLLGSRSGRAVDTGLLFSLDRDSLLSVRDDGIAAAHGKRPGHRLASTLL